ncbi:signal transduction histidine kinase [Longilinea arvoryzae]|uniref:histidine kinase n=1 Tax=Longilinea arvoryzae TaxID=360412 RepID=A0A0S7BF56_9CHLR|nr:sensor histidine kinase [Longilinea arvoryzae]GAP12658.1 signal transduction histidine kinase [Longilinea arvoryzae]
MRSFFSGLRGKLTLTYTLVTVLALMAIMVVFLVLGALLTGLTESDRRGYLSDVVSVLYPQANKFLQPGAEDLPGLQEWLEGVAESGYASLPAQDVFDSPAAAIAPDSELLVISPDMTVLAQTPLHPNNLVGRHYVPSQDFISQSILDKAFEGSRDALALSVTTDKGDTRMAVPIFQTDSASSVVGVILLTLEPSPSMLFSTLPVYVGGIVGAGLLMLIAVAPFGALFGFIMSRGLTRRLSALSDAADAWSEGDFRPLPIDRSRDEIGVLGLRMRNMAERVQNLLHTQQELAILEERNRLARDLHDTVKQQSFATFMQIRAARNLLNSDPAAAEKHLTEAESLIKSSQQDLSLLITELRPAALEDQGLSGALRAYLITWNEYSRIPATLQVTGERRLPLALEQTLFRVTQEALSNVARHSRASAATLQLDIQAELVRLEIADNGVGFDPKQVAGKGFGLESMSARMAELGGWLKIHSAQDEGTRVVAVAPLMPKGQLIHAN